MQPQLRIGKFQIYWLNGGAFEMDGGTMFGAVPKALWSKKYPAEDNYIKLVNCPLLIKTPEVLVVVETGLGNKLSAKQKQIFRLSREWDIPADLQELQINREDIDYVILTHCDFDHAGGIVMLDESGRPQLTFPKAKHVIQHSEWHDATNPNRRSAHTYWPTNFSELHDSENILLVKDSFQVCAGVEVIHTGGHTRGHQIVRLESEGEVAYHLADLLPTHAHFNPLWIMAYDNFPLEVVELKEKLEDRGVEEKAWFTFYHDPFMHACKFDANGTIIAHVDVPD
jgi:glyoxylase-like metal-dependent hydrolase (beta-lactamase superfamily II)